MTNMIVAAIPMRMDGVARAIMKYRATSHSYRAAANKGRCTEVKKIWVFLMVTLHAWFSVWGVMCATSHDTNHVPYVMAIGMGHFGERPPATANAEERCLTSQVCKAVWMIGKE